MSPVIECADLCVDFGATRILHDVSLRLHHGQALAMVGESGSGKSMTTKAILQILPKGAKTSGSVRFEGREVLAMRPAELRAYRGSDVSIIFQDPKAHINPVRTIGEFLTETLRDGGARRAEARRRAAAALGDVGLAAPEEKLDQYPHEFSGGMLQRVMIASVVLAQPKVILADEPTTALDVTTQAEVMSILKDLRERTGMAMLLITHDLELATATCDTISVMNSGRILETQSEAAFEANPSHPYSRQLAAARPSVDRRADRLPTVTWRFGDEATEGAEA